ncbi:MAG: CehA/McbA family metallohydrolase [Myxococcota bacterium]
MVIHLLIKVALLALVMPVLSVACSEVAPPDDTETSSVTSTDVTAGSEAADGVTADDAASVDDDVIEVPRSLPVGSLTAVDGVTNFAVVSAGWYRGDFHYHTTHSEDALEQGGEGVGMALAIADFYRHPIFEEGHPEQVGNSLDFVAVTDHRTDSHLSDPEFTHDHLIVIPGEEYGGSGHAGIFGLKQHIPHEPQAGESANQRHLDAIEEAHGQGAIFSVNHPLDENNWVWDTPNIDAIEVWNGPWAGFYMGSSTEELEADIAAAGVANPFIRDARDANDTDGHNVMALRFWQNHLTAGRHIPVVGGSDRHMLFPPAFPATYVRKPTHPEFEGKEGHELGYEGIVAGVKEGGTFVSRTPFGAQVDLHAVDADGTRYPLGAELPRGGMWRIEVRVSRAFGGLLRLLTGPLKEAVDGQVSAETSVLAEVEIPSDLAEGAFEWEVPEGGGWLHAIVLEPLMVDSDPPVQALEAIASLSEPVSGNALVVLAEVMLRFIVDNSTLMPHTCDPAAWEPWTAQCMPIDDDPLGTFHIPDDLARLIHVWFEGGEATEFCMGAVSSAFLVRGQ